MVFCNKCGAIMTGSVCPRCGAGADNADDSKKESGNSGITGGSLGNGVSGNNGFTGGSGNSGFTGGGFGNNAFGGGTAPKSPFAGGGAVNSPFGGSGAGNSAFGGSAFGFGAFGKSGFGNSSYGSPEEVAEQNKKTLISKLERYRNLLEENEELETMIKPQSSFPVTEEMNFKKRSFMKYFWPFLVAAPIVGYVIYFLSTMLTMDSINNYESFSMTQQEAQAAATRIMGDAFLGFAVALIVAAAIIVFGIVISKRKQSEFNSSADFMNREASERYQKGLENQRMINLQQSNIQEMHQYESLVPNDYRTSIRVGKIIEFIKNGDADNVEDACELIKTAAPDPEPAADLTGIFS